MDGVGLFFRLRILRHRRVLKIKHRINGVGVIERGRGFSNEARKASPAYRPAGERGARRSIVRHDGDAGHCTAGAGRRV
jgi:hypothetical protein